MIAVTLDAAKKLKELIAEENKDKEIPETAGLRLFVQGGGCSGFQYGLMIESAPQESDLVVESNGIKVFVDPISQNYVKNALVALINDPSGERLTIENPNATSTCGCGQSFSVD